MKRAQIPAQLDIFTRKQLTAEYQATKAAVWNKPYIRETLLKSSFEKCAYCEARIEQESKYLEVDHFRCKIDFPDRVVEWENLIPACKRCNGQKGRHNVDRDGMLINPYDTKPAQHIYLRNYRLRSRDALGKETVDALHLNDSERLVAVRFAIGEVIAETLSKILGQLETFLKDTSNVKSNRTLLRSIDRLLRTCLPDKQFSATAATILLEHPDFSLIKTNLESLSLWGDFVDLENELLAIYL